MSSRGMITCAYQRRLREDKNELMSRIPTLVAKRLVGRSMYAPVPPCSWETHLSQDYHIFALYTRRLGDEPMGWISVFLGLGGAVIPLPRSVWINKVYSPHNVIYDMDSRKVKPAFYPINGLLFKQ